MSKRLVLVDSDNRMWASFFAYKRLKYKGESVASIYGFPSMMKGLLKKFNPDELILVWDGQKSKHRLKLIPDYKGGRKTKELIDFDNFLHQKEVVRKLMNNLGVKQVINPIAEADDMIYKLTKLAPKMGFDEVIIVSSDKDFNQLINPAWPEVQVYVEKIKLKTLINAKNCKDIYGYEYYQTVDYLTLDGDTSDNIPGYPGIGPVKASELLEQYGTLVNFIQSNDNHSIIDKERLLEIIKINRVMIDLPYFYSIHKKDLKTVFYKDDKNPKINREKFLKLSAKYNMQKLMSSSFINQFKHLQK